MENSAWFWLIARSWPLQNAQPLGGKLNPTMRISPMNGSDMRGLREWGVSGEHGLHQYPVLVPADGDEEHVEPAESVVGDRVRPLGHVGRGAGAEGERERGAGGRAAGPRGRRAQRPHL